MEKSRNGPITGHGRGDPSLRFGTGGDPPWVFGFRGDPAKVEARGDPPEIESRGDPPEKIFTRNGHCLEWLVFNRIGSRNGPNGRGMPGWKQSLPLPFTGGVREYIIEDSGLKIEKSDRNTIEEDPIINVEFSISK